MTSSRARHTPRGLRLGVSTVVVHFDGRRTKTWADLAQVGRATRRVRIMGVPTLWGVKEILRLAPDLEKFEVSCARRKDLDGERLMMLESRGVEVAVGAGRITARGVPNTRAYVKNRAFMHGLTGEALAKWEEILDAGYAAAEMAARYFELDGHEYMSQNAIAEEFGYARRVTVSFMINGVLKYLDPSMSVGKQSDSRARWLTTQVRNRRRFAEEKAAHEKKSREVEALCRDLNIEHLPEGLPDAEVLTYAAVLTAVREGIVGALAVHRPAWYRALALHWGLDDGPYRTLAEVGREVGLTREWVRRLVGKALRRLGVSR